MRLLFSIKTWMGILALVTLYNSYQLTSTSASMVTFDKKVIVSQFVGQLSHLKLTSEQSLKKSSQFSKALDSALRDYALAHKAVVLKKETVLAGRDITSEIMKDVAAQMRANHE